MSLVMAPKGLGTRGLGPGLSPFWIVTLAAVMPDVDFLWGRHNQETHSLGAAVLAGLLVYVWKKNARLAIAVTLAWTSHVLFDWLGSDTTPPLGVMALWPFSRDYYFADAFFFEAISRRYWLDGFVAHNLWAVFTELVYLGLPALALWQWRRQRRSTARAT